MVLLALNTAYQYCVKEIPYLIWVTIFKRTSFTHSLTSASHINLLAVQFNSILFSVNVRGLQPACTSQNRKIPDKMLIHSSVEHYLFTVSYFLSRMKYSRTNLPRMTVNLLPVPFNL